MLDWLSPPDTEEWVELPSRSHYIPWMILLFGYFLVFAVWSAKILLEGFHL